MHLMSKIATSAGLAAAAALIAVAPASAATSQPISNSINTIAPGGLGDVGFYYSNGEATAASGAVTVVLNAPSNASFTEDRIWGMDFAGATSSGSSRPVLTGCTLNASSTQMTCTGTLNVNAAQGATQSSLQLTAQVRVANGAPANERFTDGAATITAGGDIRSGSVALQYATPAEAETPVIAPVIGAGALAAAGVAGGVALLRRKLA